MFDSLRKWVARRIYGASYSPTDDYWYGPVAAPSVSGILVTPTVAKQQATVATCVRVLSESFAYLPAFVFERLPDGGRKIARDHRLSNKIHSTPNSWQTSFEFNEMLVSQVCYRGNFYARKLDNGDLIPLHPDYMTQIEQMPDGTLRYTWDKPDDPKSGVYHQDDILHIRDSSEDGIWGQSRIQTGTNTIGMAVAAETHGSNILRNGVRSAYGIKLPEDFGDEAAVKFSESYAKNFGGYRNADKSPVFEKGAEPVSLGMSSIDAQLLENRQYQRSEIAGLFRVPAHMVNDLGDATFSNVTELGIGFATYSLGPWCVRIRQAMERSLLSEEERETYFIDFVMDAFVRGDIEKRSKSYALAMDRWQTSNEIRKLENLPPLPGGDELKEPVGGRGANQVPSQNPTESDPNSDPNARGKGNGYGALVLSRDLTGNLGDPTSD